MVERFALQYKELMASPFKWKFPLRKSETNMEIQAWLSQSIGDLATVLQLGYAFGAGMVSAVNPRSLK